jgi:putative oxidoreductase
VSDHFQRPLYIPALGSIYEQLAPFAETLLRITAGGFLIIHGLPKFGNLAGVTGMVENLGFYPGTIWAPLLAITESLGGLLLAIGLFTRPAAFATMIVLLVTVYFHWIFKGEGFGGAEKSLLWAAILFFFALHGANRHSVDAKLGKEF